MSAKIRGLGMMADGVAQDVGLSIMQLGMITGLHAAISPSFFTFACFAKKPTECLIAKKTLWASLIATTVVNAGVLLAFRRWAPAITGQIVGTGLFIGGMIAVGSDKAAPNNPSMESQVTEPDNLYGVGRIRGLGYNPTVQPNELKAQSHWIDRNYRDTYSEWWKVPDTVDNWK